MFKNFNTFYAERRAKEDFDYVIPMDGDGEDRPEEISEFINHAQKVDNKAIVGKRIKRSEDLLFKICYQMHKLITLTFTGKSIKYGNFTCLPKKTVVLLSIFWTSAFFR